MDVSEKVTATLRAQEHGHEPIICLAFDAYNMADTGKVAKTLNSAATDTDHIPVICLQANCIDRADTARENGCGWSEEGVSYTLNIIDRHAICYEEHTKGKVATMSHDLFSTRFGEDENGIVQTLSGRMGTGGGNTPLVLMAFGGTDANAAITDGTVAPTMLARAGTGGGNEPIVLMEIQHESIPKDNRGAVR